MNPREKRAFKKQLQKTVGKRLIAARQLSGLTADKAARAIGYTNGSKLSKIENASDTMSVPSDTVVALAQLYCVSTDFIYGLVADWDETLGTTSDRSTALWLHDAFERTRTREIWIIKRALRRNELTLKSVSMMVDQFAKLVEAFDKFVDFNPDFVDMKGGNRMMMAFQKMREISAIADGNLKRMKFEHRRDAGTQGDLFDGYNEGEEEPC
jgi:transcriptional regulator with XRE-family HTH domain